MSNDNHRAPETDLDRFYFDQATRYQREALELREELKRERAEKAMVLDRLVSVDQEIGRWRDGFAGMADLMTSLRLVLRDLLAAKDGKLGADRTERAYQRAEELLTPDGALEEEKRRRAIVDAAERLPIATVTQILQRAAELGYAAATAADVAGRHLTALDKALEGADVRGQRPGRDMERMLAICAAADALPLLELHDLAKGAGDRKAQYAISELFAALADFYGEKQLEIAGPRSGEQA